MMVRSRLVFLVAASCGLVTAVTKFSSFVVGPDMKAKEEWYARVSTLTMSVLLTLDFAGFSTG